MEPDMDAGEIVNYNESLKEEHTAFHEAGHAVVGYHCGISGISTTIIPHEKRDILEQKTILNPLKILSVMQIAPPNPSCIPLQSCALRRTGLTQVLWPRN